MPQLTIQHRNAWSFATGVGRALRGRTTLGGGGRALVTPELKEGPAFVLDLSSADTKVH